MTWHLFALVDGCELRLGDFPNPEAALASLEPDPGDVVTLREVEGDLYTGRRQRWRFGWGWEWEPCHG